MNKKLLVLPIFLFILFFLAFNGNDEPAPTYVGTRACVCHAPILQSWSTTGHSQIQQTPGPGTVTAGNWNSTINMGSAYGNTTATLSLVNGIYKVTLNPSSGPPVTYDVAYTMDSTGDSIILQNNSKQLL
jgi:hypothetical protein